MKPLKKIKDNRVKCKTNETDCTGGMECLSDTNPPLKTCKKCLCYTCTNGKCRNYKRL
jgi:hypothetical protein